MYLFQDRKLQPGTIDGYRSAIADKLENSPFNVSKDENLTLLDSFHGNRPKGWTGIPSWNLSLVLHQLTKVPFELIKEASLKHLTFKTVFSLLALGSGKRRSEIHAWQKRTSDTSQTGQRCSCIHHPAFLPRISWPRRVQRVWPQWLYHPWPQFWISPSSLLVRALHYYLDRTSGLRQNKELILVSFKKGFDKDISPAAISSWINRL